MIWIFFFLYTATSALIAVCHCKGRSGAVPEGTHFTVAPEKHAWINLSWNQDVQVETKKETEEEKEDIVPKWGEILLAVE